MRSTVLALAALAALLAAAPDLAAEEDGATKAEKANLLRRAAMEYQNLKPRSIVDDWVHKRVMLIESVGELRFGPAVTFLAKVLADDGSMRVRVAAIVALGKTGTKKAVQTAVTIALRERKETLLVDALPWGFRFCEDPKAAEWLAKTMLRSRDPNMRRAVALSLARMGNTAGALPHLLKATREKDITVLYELLKALGRTADEKAFEALFKFAESRDWRLREAVATALGYFGSQTALGKLKEMVKDRDWHVQESAVLSLKRLNKKECIPILIEALKSTHLRVAEEIRVTLEKMTGKNFGYDSELWQSWWDLKGKKDPKPKKGHVSKVVTYHGIKVISDRVVFVVDTSGSMEAVGPSGESRMDLAKKELLLTLGALNSRTYFNIVTFSASPMMFEREMQKATPANKKRAEEFLTKQNPFSQTNTFDTLKKVLSEVKGLDTIFFLSDGIPTTGRYMLQEKILAEISKLNQFLKVRIHSIALLVGTYGAAGAPPEPKEILEHFMRRLAEENDGQFILKK